MKCWFWKMTLLFFKQFKITKSRFSHICLSFSERITKRRNVIQFGDSRHNLLGFFVYFVFNFIGKFLLCHVFTIPKLLGKIKLTDNLICSFYVSVLSRI